MSKPVCLAILLFLAMLLPGVSQTAEVSASSEENSTQVMQAFGQGDGEESEIVTVDDKTKRIVMFAMGVPLLILLLVTGALGVAMGVYGKPVFVAHMICAGLSMSLAMAHAVAGVVWFYPF